MEINKCLEDPNTQYSDQYMPLAMMPAVVEAIQNAGGGSSQKYGPYIMQTGTSATVTKNGTKAFIPNVITDADGKSYYIPDDGKAHVFEIASLGMSGYKLTLTGFSTVYDLTHEIAPTVSYRNDTDSSITVPANTTLMEIYSDIPFTEFDEGEA